MGYAGITPDGQYIYATTSNWKLIKIDLVQNTVTPVTTVNRNGSVAITPDGKYVFVTDPGGYAFFEPIPTGLVTIVRTSDDQIDGYVDYGAGVITDWIVISPTGKYAYVSHWGSSVSMIDLQKRQIIWNFEFLTVSALIVPIVLGPKP
jgi:DNA-binding beta-propeller fold protein YncE